MRTVISIRDLHLHGHHGLGEAERALGQRFLFSARCYLGEVASHCDDRLAYSIGYDVLAAEIAAVSMARDFRTIETLAENIACTLLDKHPVIEAIDVSVAKFSPPMPYLLGSASVEISLTRAEFSTLRDDF